MQYNWKRNAGVFLASQAISILGSSLVQYAILWHITLTTQSGVFATLSIICGFLPTLFLSPFAGVWADRYDRKKLIVLADGGIALATLILAITFSLGYDAIWTLLATMAVRAFGSAVQNPCVNAMLPSIVPTEELTRVNGLYSSVNSIIFIASPILSGALMGFASLQVIFFIDVITAALAIAVMMLFLHLPEKTQGAEEVTGTDYFAEMKAGFAYIRSQKYLVHFFAFCVAFFFLASPLVNLTPLQVTRNFGDNARMLAAIEVAFSVGMLGGGLLLTVWPGLKNRTHTLVLSSFLLAAGQMALGLPLNFVAYMIVMGLLGLILTYFNTPAIVLLQERVEPAYMGRVFGVMTMLTSSVMPLSMLLFGPLADVIKIDYMLLATGAAMFVVAVAIMKDKPLIRAGKSMTAKVQIESNV